MSSVNGYVAFFDVSVSLPNGDEGDDDEVEEEHHDDDDNDYDDEERRKMLHSSFSRLSFFFIISSPRLFLTPVFILLSYSLISFLPSAR